MTKTKSKAARPGRPRPLHRTRPPADVSSSTHADQVCTGSKSPHFLAITRDRRHRQADRSRVRSRKFGLFRSAFRTYHANPTRARVGQRSSAADCRTGDSRRRRTNRDSAPVRFWQSPLDRQALDQMQELERRSTNAGGTSCAYCVCEGKALQNKATRRPANTIFCHRTQRGELSPRQAPRVIPAAVGAHRGSSAAGSRDKGGFNPRRWHYANRGVPLCLPATPGRGLDIEDFSATCPARWTAKAANRVQDSRTDTRAQSASLEVMAVAAPGRMGDINGGTVDQTSRKDGGSGDAVSRAGFVVCHCGPIGRGARFKIWPRAGSSPASGTTTTSRGHGGACELHTEHTRRMLRIGVYETHGPGSTPGRETGERQHVGRAGREYALAGGGRRSFTTMDPDFLRLRGTKRFAKPAGKAARKLTRRSQDDRPSKVPPTTNTLCIRNDPQDAPALPVEEIPAPTFTIQPKPGLAKSPRPSSAADSPFRVAPGFHRYRIPTSAVAAGHVILEVFALASDQRDEPGFRRFLHPGTAFRPFVADREIFRQ